MESINKMMRTGAIGAITNYQLRITKSRRSLLTWICNPCATASNYYKPARLASNLLSILMLLLILHGCKKEDGLDNPKADAFNGTVTAKVENGASYDAEISSVYALYEATVNSVTGQLTGQTLGNGDYANGGFTISMSTIAEAYLKTVEWFFSDYLGISAELDYSDSAARMLDADFYAISGSQYLDYFIYTTKGSKPTMCLFVYVDSDVTVKGKNVSVALLQGWNRIYCTPADKKVVSNAPGGMKWYLNKDVN